MANEITTQTDVPKTMAQNQSDIQNNLNDYSVNEFQDNYLISKKGDTSGQGFNVSKDQFGSSDELTSYISSSQESQDWLGKKFGAGELGTNLDFSVLRNRESQEGYTAPGTQTVETTPTEPTQPTTEPTTQTNTMSKEDMDREKFQNKLSVDSSIGKTPMKVSEAVRFATENKLDPNMTRQEAVLAAEEAQQNAYTENMNVITGIVKNLKDVTTDNISTLNESFNNILELNKQQIDYAKDKNDTMQAMIDKNLDLSKQVEEMNYNKSLNEANKVYNQNLKDYNQKIIDTAKQTAKDRTIRARLAGFLGTGNTGSSAKSIYEAFNAGQQMVASLQEARRDSSVEHAQNLDMITQRHELDTNKLIQDALNNKMTMQFETQDSINEIIKNMALSEKEKAQAIMDVNNRYLDTFNAMQLELNNMLTQRAAQTGAHATAIANANYQDTRDRIADTQWDKQYDLQKEASQLNREKFEFDKQTTLQQLAISRARASSSSNNSDSNTGNYSDEGYSLAERAMQALGDNATPEKLAKYIKDSGEPIKNRMDALNVLRDDTGMQIDNIGFYNDLKEEERLSVIENYDGDLEGDERMLDGLSNDLKSISLQLKSNPDNKELQESYDDLTRQKDILSSEMSSKLDEAGASGKVFQDIGLVEPITFTGADTNINADYEEPIEGNPNTQMFYSNSNVYRHDPSKPDVDLTKTAEMGEFINEKGHRVIVKDGEAQSIIVGNRAYSVSDYVKEF
ncbi:MAG: hypothetical protein U9O94_07595, partial [Nanoarchaeota archaeon]|nr:hypothetical protein [Nanoarchaeota archaeon]